MAEQNTPNNPESAKQESGIIPEVRQELSKVAANPKQSILILAGIILVAGYFVFRFFFSGNDDAPKQEDSTPTPTIVAKPAQDSESATPPIPQLPEPPKLVEPVVTTPKIDDTTKKPDTTPPLPSLPTLVEDTTSKDSATKDNGTQSTLPPGAPIPNQAEDDASKRKEAKRKANIVLVSGTTPQKTAEQKAQEAVFQARGDMSLLLGRGKIIEAVVESAVNTDFGGEVRAVVSRDVFSESGRNILVPKGSKVYGVYTATVSGTYGRIDVMWQRIDLASGYTLTLDAMGADSLGRKGYQGRVDNKVKEKMTNAVLTSAFNILIAEGIDKLVTPVQTSQAATQSQNDATNISNLAQTISTSTATGTSDALKVQQLCTQIPADITDKTSTAYTTFVSSCSSIQSSSMTDPQKLAAVMTAVTTASTSLAASTATSTTPTQAQSAAKTAFTDITNTAKDIATQHTFTTTVTIDQGTAVKIIVNKDYTFPRSAISKSRRLE